MHHGAHAMPSTENVDAIKVISVESAEEVRFASRCGVGGDARCPHARRLECVSDGLI